jgi:hypothetical protein
MPDIFKLDKQFIINQLKRKEQCLVTSEGVILYAEDLEEIDINDCCVSLHA